MRKRNRRRWARAAAAAFTAGSLWLGAGGCGSSGDTATSSSATTVVLDMKAGGNAYDVKRCGVTHHYTTYKATDRHIEYGGQVTPPPSGRWEVKLKIERCHGRAFQTVHQVHARGQTQGYASDVIPNLPAGYYFGRLYYYQGNKAAAQSDKEYFLLR